MSDKAIHATHAIQARFPGEVRFCALCGTEMVPRTVLPDRKTHPVCPGCGFVFFATPKLVAGCLITAGSRVLLLKRGNEPSPGKWTFPGGFVEFGEAAADAAMRETLEEVRMRVRVRSLLGVYTDPANGNAQIIVYLAEPEDGSAPESTIEAPEARYFFVDEIPWKELAFQSTTEALRDWSKLNGG